MNATIALVEEALSSPWQGPSLHGLTISGFSPLHWSPIRQVTILLSIPSPHVAEHCGRDNGYWGAELDSTSQSLDSGPRKPKSLAKIDLGPVGFSLLLNQTSVTGGNCAARCL